MQTPEYHVNPDAANPHAEINMKMIAEEYKRRLTPEDLKWYEQDHDLIPSSDVLKELKAYVAEVGG